MQLSFFSLGFERPDLSVCRFVGGMKVGSSRNSCCCMGSVGPFSPASEGGCDCSAIVETAGFGALRLLFTLPVCASWSLSVLCLLAWKVGSSSSAMFLMCWLCLRRQRQKSAVGGSEKLWTRVLRQLQCSGGGAGRLVLWGAILRGGGKALRVKSLSLDLRKSLIRNMKKH